MPLNQKIITSSLLSLSLVIISSAASAHKQQPVLLKDSEPAMVEILPKWTGFYVGAGAGLGAWTGDVTLTIDGFPATLPQKQGGKGPFATVIAGYDYLFCNGILAGVFIDGQSAYINGDLAFASFVGSISETDSWDIGARLGKLINPTVLPYLTGGFSRAYFDKVSYIVAIPGVGDGGFGLATRSFVHSGWFAGFGMEAKLNSNWSVKIEYRYADYGTQSTLLTSTSPFVLNSRVLFSPVVQTTSAVLIYKF